MMHPFRCALAAVVAAALAVPVAAGTNEPVPLARTATLLAVGDIASCFSGGDEQTAALARSLRGPIAVLGDIAYDSGSTGDYRSCFRPSWGRLIPRLRPALGNHEYGTGTAAATVATFRLPRDGWYSYELGTWHVIALNSNCEQVGGCGPGSRQWRWLRADLASHPARCTLAYWHHPRYSSGLHGSDARVAPLWDALAKGGVDVVLAGHDHDYERFAPRQGMRSFVVGTGGRSHYPFATALPGSQVRNASAYGLLRLTLRPAAYDWRFLPVAGESFTDAGSDRCR